MQKIIQENVYNPLPISRFEPKPYSQKYLSRTQAEHQFYREKFSQDLYEEVSRRQTLTEENLTTNEKLRPLALELAANPKYKGYLSNNKFAREWMFRFRKRFNLDVLTVSLTPEEKKEICDYKRENPTTSLREMVKIFTSRFDKNFGRTMLARILKDSQSKTDEEIELIRETFSQDLFAEVSRRQSLTTEYLSNEKVRSLAKELAVDPKYEGYFSSNNFSYRWMANFRKKFNMDDLYKKRFTLDEKLQIIQFIDSNPGLTNVVVGRHFSTILGRKVDPGVVRKIKLNREKYLKNEANQDALTIEENTED